MEDGQQFVDYYDVLQVNPGCEARILEIAYHYFAKMYHPDNPETANVDKFSQVTEAYGILRDADKRAQYDRLYLNHTDGNGSAVPFHSELEIDEETAVSDAEIHEKMLLHLYKRRRESAADAGVIGWLLQEALECTDEQFEFHVWYLKSKGFLEITEQGSLAITIEGVDQVISVSRKTSVEKLLLAKSAENEENSATDGE